MPKALAGSDTLSPQFINGRGFVGIIRHHNSEPIPYYNPLSDALLPGEPFFHLGLVCISNSLIRPKSWGEAYTSWVADMLVNPAISADIIQGQQLWWSYAIDVPGFGTSVGGAVITAPTNGFIIGKAVGHRDCPINGSGKAVVATTGATRVRIAAYNQVATAIGTVPAFN